MKTPKVSYAPFMKRLWELAGEIGTKGETDDRYAKVYAKLSATLDVAEEVKLIEQVEEVY